MSDRAEAQTNYPEEPGTPDVNPEVNEPLDAASLAAHYEQEDVNIGALVRFGVAVGVGATVFALILWFVMGLWTGRTLRPVPRVVPAEVRAPEAPGPGLDAAPEYTLEMVKARDAERLDRYGWVDRENGVVHMPIEEAMRLMVENGVPARDAPVPDFGLDAAYQLDGSGGSLPVENGQGDDADSDEATSGEDASADAESEDDAGDE